MFGQGLQITQMHAEVREPQPQESWAIWEAPTSEHNVDNQQLVTKDNSVNLLS